MRPHTLLHRAVDVAHFGISGPGIRYPRPHILFYRQRVQPLCVTPSLSKIEALTSTPQQHNVDDHFIPLVTGAGSSGVVGKDRRSNHTTGVDDEWEAEIVITAPTSEEIVGDTSKAVRKSPEVTEVNTPESSSQSIEQTETLDTKAPVEISAPAMSRAASRLARKERRLKDGTYLRMAREAQLTGGVAEDIALEQDAVTESALKALEAMDGPPLLKKGPAKFKEKNLSGKDEKVSKSKDRVEGVPNAESTTKVFKRPEAEPWQVRKAALAAKFGDAGWQPQKRLSPDTLEGIRALHRSDPISYSTAILSEHFKITPDAIRRILKSKWRPNEDEVEDRRQRWERRGVKKWTDMADQGVKPPAKWRALGVKSPAARIRERRTKDDGYIKWDNR
jgi:hypothetical protein